VRTQASGATALLIAFSLSRTRRLREIARFALEGAGYEVVEAATGPEGIAKAETERPISC